MKRAIEILMELIAAFLFGLPIWLLWNSSVVEAVPVSKISYITAVGLYVFCDLLKSNHRTDKKA